MGSAGSGVSTGRGGAGYSASAAGRRVRRRAVSVIATAVTAAETTAVATSAGWVAAHSSAGTSATMAAWVRRPGSRRGRSVQVPAGWFASASVASAWVEVRCVGLGVWAPDTCSWAVGAVAVRCWRVVAVRCWRVVAVRCVRTRWVGRGQVVAGSGGVVRGDGRGSVRAGATTAVASRPPLVGEGIRNVGPIRKKPYDLSRLPLSLTDS
jgi:hypothetical protein